MIDDKGYDVEVIDEGTVVLFILANEGVTPWVHDNLDIPSWCWMGERSFAVEHRYADTIRNLLMENGFTLKS